MTHKASAQSSGINAPIQSKPSATLSESSPTCLAHTNFLESCQYIGKRGRTQIGDCAALNNTDIVEDWQSICRGPVAMFVYNNPASHRTYNLIFLLLQHFHSHNYPVGPRTRDFTMLDQLAVADTSKVASKAT